MWADGYSWQLKYLQERANFVVISKAKPEMLKKISVERNWEFPYFSCFNTNFASDFKLENDKEFQSGGVLCFQMGKEYKMIDQSFDIINTPIYHTFTTFRSLEAYKDLAPRPSYSHIYYAYIFFSFSLCVCVCVCVCVRVCVRFDVKPTFQNRAIICCRIFAPKKSKHYYFQIQIHFHTFALQKYKVKGN